MVGEKSGPKMVSYESINYLFGSAQWMHPLLQSPSCDLFNFLMTTLFNTIKSIQPEIKEGDPTFPLEPERHRIFANNSLDISLPELYRPPEVKAIVKTIDEVTFTFFSIYTEIYHITLHKPIEGKPPLEKTYKFVHKTVFEIVKATINKDVSEQTLQSLLKIS